MTIDSCFEFGKILKPHGLKGELLVHVTTDQASNLKGVKGIFIEVNARLVPFFMEKFTITQKTKAIVQLEDMQTEAQALPLLGKVIYIPLQALPALGKDQFYYHEVKGYAVVDEKLGILGTVKEIYEMPGQDLIEIEYRGSEVLIPISNEIVHKADHKEKTVSVKLPDGLLEMYTDSNKEENTELHED